LYVRCPGTIWPSARTIWIFTVTRRSGGPRSPTDHERHGVHDPSARAAELLIADAERVGEFVHEHAHLRVGRDRGGPRNRFSTALTALLSSPGCERLAARQQTLA
jgi:hypothetical protein